MRLAILAFTVLALSGVAYADDDNDGGDDGDNAAVTEETTPAAPAAAPQAEVSSSIEPEVCTDGKAPPCVTPPLPKTVDDAFAAAAPGMHAGGYGFTEHRGK